MGKKEQELLVRGQASPPWVSSFTSRLFFPSCDRWGPGIPHSGVEGVSEAPVMMPLCPWAQQAEEAQEDSDFPQGIRERVFSGFAASNRKAPWD